MSNNKPQLSNNNKSKKISSQLEISSFTFMTVFLGVVIMLLIFFSMIINNMKINNMIINKIIYYFQNLLY